MSIPIIGITTRKDLTPAGLPAVMVLQAYVSAIVQAGGAPVLIPSDLPEAGWSELVRRLDGILFTGGGDVAIERFAGPSHPKVGGVDAARDEIELGLVRSAAKSGMPFLGICRGLQVVNVALGGTLYTDILDQAADALDHNFQSPDILKERIQLVHTVEIQTDSRVGEILGALSLHVNSLHHQGVKDLAPALRASAFAPDGIIEAVELSGHPFGVAVQWHPEWLTGQAATLRLFKAFVEAAVPNNFPIGIFDSGAGGLSVLRAMQTKMPAEELVYFGDQAHVPYGPRPLDEVCAFSEEITRFLLAKNAKLIVVACNSASAAALPHLRETFPGLPFVGMEPAIKPAVEHTRSGVVGVLATPATFQGALYASVLERFAHGVTVLQHTCTGLVEQIEKGALDAPETESILRGALMPMLAQGIDTIVLGCTHYPFVIPLIQRIVGEDVRVIDPAPAVARQVARLLDAGDLRHAERESAPHTYYSSGAVAFEALLPMLIGQAADVNEVAWEGRTLRMRTI